jgi:hypothetical protein
VSPHTISVGGQIATFTSSDGSVAIEGGPAQGQIDLRVAGGAQGGTALSSLQSQIAAINANLIHPYVFTDFLVKGDGSNTKVDWQGTGTVAGNAYPSAAAITTAGSGGAQQVVAPLNIPAVVSDAKFQTWAVGDRASITQWGNSGYIALVCMYLGGVFTCVGMHAAVSNTFLSIFIVNGAGAILGNPVLTSVPLSAVQLLQKDWVLLWDNISVRAFLGDQRTRTPLVQVGEMEDGNDITAGLGFPAMICQQSAGGDCGGLVDYMYATTVLVP